MVLWMFDIAAVRTAVALSVVLPLGGCLAGLEALSIGFGAATVAGARSASSEIEQIYYLGVLDPRDQLPPTVYRVRVHGQASALGLTNFASGWVKAEVIDSLGTTVSFENNQAKIAPATGAELAGFETGRRLVMFGPEGFREAPKGHRLVIVMGSNPQGFFNAVDRSLGIVAEAQVGKRDEALDRKLFEALVHLRNEREALRLVKADVDSDVPSARTLAVSASNTGASNTGTSGAGTSGGNNAGASANAGSAAGNSGSPSVGAGTGTTVNATTANVSVTNPGTPAPVGAAQ